MLCCWGCTQQHSTAQHSTGVHTTQHNTTQQHSKHVCALRAAAVLVMAPALPCRACNACFTDSRCHSLWPGCTRASMPHIHPALMPAAYAHVRSAAVRSQAVRCVRA